MQADKPRVGKHGSTRTKRANARTGELEILDFRF